MTKTQNIVRTPIANGEIGSRKYRVTKVTGEIQNSQNQEEFNKYENIELAWVKVNPDTKEEAYDLIKGEDGRTHKVSAEKVVNIPAEVVGAVFSVKKKD